MIVVKNKEELEELINQRIKEQGPNCDLNDIDVSNVTDMSDLFYRSKFNGDISRWDVSNVKDMSYMFYFSDFNGDISRWDVSNVKNMKCMFYGSKFNGDVSRWKVSSKTGPWSMNGMFDKSPLEGNEPSWYMKK